MAYEPGYHHRRSVRLETYDYSRAGLYFVTLCTRNRIQHLSKPAIAEIARRTWQAIPEHAPGVSLDEWVVMPNHVHGLLVLPEGIASSTLPNRPELETNSEGRMASISPRRHSLAVVVRTYKAAVTTECRKAGYAGFAWQVGYYEHVVRDQSELEAIRQYIYNNPAKWELDHANPQYQGRRPPATPWYD